MKKLKPVRVWAALDQNHKSLDCCDIFWRKSASAWASSVRGDRIVPCMLVPIEPKRKVRRK